MAKLGKIEIQRDYGTRPHNVHTADDVWYVEEGKPYDFVKFTIEEIKGHYWYNSLCVECGLSEGEIHKIVEEYVSEITDERITYYQRFIDYMDRYGY